MKLFTQILVLGLAAEGTFASSWFSKAAYNKWHETELERWLSDNDVPYPAPADRKDLENLVKENWQSKISTPYNEWDSARLNSFLKQKGVDTKDVAAENTEGLIAQVKNYWYETEDKAESAWGDVKEWIFDSWSDSQLKAFADKHGIPVPQPRKRDTLIQKLRTNYETISKKAGETASYPGNWLYSTWSESDLKEFLDEHGIPAPQPTTRDKLIASVRRNSRVAGLKLSDAAASASKSAAAATETLSDKLLNSWSDSQIKEWADKNGIKVPQGSKRNELLAIARKHRAQLTGDNASYSAKVAASKASVSGASAFGAATSSVASHGSKATDYASAKAEAAFESAIGTWSESRLKAYLDSRGVPVPQSGKKDELVAAVRLTSTRPPPDGLRGPLIHGLLIISSLISHHLVTRLPRRQASKLVLLVSNFLPPPKMLMPLLRNQVDLLTHRLPLILPFKLMPPRAPSSILGPSLISRTILIHTASMSHKAQPRTN